MTAQMPLEITLLELCFAWTMRARSWRRSHRYRRMPHMPFLVRFANVLATMDRTFVCHGGQPVRLIWSSAATEASANVAACGSPCAAGPLRALHDSLGKDR